MPAEIELTLDVYDADTIAELQDILADELSDWPISVRQSGPQGETKGDPVTLLVTAIILAVPPAIESTLNLADRIRIGERLNAAVDRLRSAVKRRGRQARASLPNGKAIDVDDLMVEQIFEAVQTQQSGAGEKHK